MARRISILRHPVIRHHSGPVHLISIHLGLLMLQKRVWNFFGCHFDVARRYAAAFVRSKIISNEVISFSFFFLNYDNFVTLLKRQELFRIRSELVASLRDPTFFNFLCRDHCSARHMSSIISWMREVSVNRSLSGVSVRLYLAWMGGLRFLHRISNTV